MPIINLHHTSTSDRLKSDYRKKDHRKLVRFLPCIAPMHTNAMNGDVTYLVAYRVWRGRTLPTKDLVNSGAKGHPWYEGWGSSSYDGTAFMTVRVSADGTKVRVLKDVIHDMGNWKVDMRLLHKQDNQYHVTFNTFGRLNPKKRADNYDEIDAVLREKCFYYKDAAGNVIHNPSRKYLQTVKNLTTEQVNRYLDWNGCTFQNKGVMTINPTTLKPTFDRISLVCPNHHGRVEKNHAMFYDENRKVAYQYAITPWSFFDAQCEMRVTMRTTLFKRVAEYYDPVNSTFSKHIQFSCSTPLVPYTRDEFLGVGHFKVHYEQLDKLPKNSPARVFMNALKKQLKINSFNFDKHASKIHYELVYGMFVYTVNRKTLKLQRASKAFMLVNKRYPKGLCYPSGLVQHNPNTFLISYHENDLNIKLWSADRTELEQLLVLDNQSPANKYPFEIITY